MQAVQILYILIALTFFGLVVDFIRRGLLKEKYAVLWLGLVGVVVVLSLWKGLLDRTAEILGVAYPPSLLFLVAFIFVLLILLHFSVVISIMHERHKVLAQEIALLKSLLKEAGVAAGGDGPGDGAANG
ncbi:MAG: DUF2304 domain-containing protein [Thermodesulfobacteriota bacterium]